jgi:hypothetical protein
MKKSVKSLANGDFEKLRDIKGGEYICKNTRSKYFSHCIFLVTNERTETARKIVNMATGKAVFCNEEEEVEHIYGVLTIMSKE